jgi:hypothetical protein
MNIPLDSHAFDRSTYDNEALCQRCYELPWDRIEYRAHSRAGHNALPQPYWEEFAVIQESREQLQESSCQLCRIFATTLETHCITFCPFRICWYDGSYEEHWSQRELGHVSFVKIVVWASLSYPHLALAAMNPSAMKEVMRRGLPKTLNVQKVNRWRSDCNARHNAICSPVFDHGLKNLKVIDCKTRIVVPVSDTYCHYVALSYVWVLCFNILLTAVTTQFCKTCHSQSRTVLV